MHDFTSVQHVVVIRPYLPDKLDDVPGSAEISAHEGLRQVFARTTSSRTETGSAFSQAASSSS
eukprot:5943488-Prorocentrum_lima.AAC.1